MYFSINFDTASLSLIILTIVSALLAGAWISKHFGRVITACARQKSCNLATDITAPSASVVIYSSYGPEILKNTLPSFLNQDYHKYEVIVVDDNYDESTKDYLTEMMLAHPQLYFTTIPQGTINLSRRKLAITLGIKAAHNDFIVIADSNCVAPGSNWLSTLMSAYTPGTELIIGNTRQNTSHDSPAALYYDFDLIFTKIKYLSFALAGEAYRADSNNFAFSKELFFRIKGFSSTLNLHYGDDDLFISQISNRTNTRVCVAAGAQLQEYLPCTVKELRDSKIRHLFTEKYLHTQSKYSGAAYYWCIWIMLGAIAALVALTPLNTATWVIAALMLAAMITLQITAFRRAAVATGGSRLCFCIPMFTFLNPIISIRYKISGHLSRKSNFTYQRRKRH